MDASPTRAITKDAALADLIRGLPDSVLADLFRNLATAPLRRAL
jgi:hypothetical protein